jgi:hypothetical protein
MTQDELMSMVRYEDGNLYWLNTGKGKKTGPIGWIENNGYRRVEIKKVRYLVHHLVWLFFNGCFPSKDIDHKDNNRSNNRIENLREVTNAENLQNLRNPLPANTTGYLGVSRYPKDKNRFVARITLNGMLRHLGIYDTAEEAHQVYLNAKRQLHPFGEIAKEHHVS